MTGFAEYHRYDGLGLAELVRTKQVTATELVEEAINCIETFNPAVNAVVYKMYEAARTAARARLPDGPFAGVPFLLKDLMSAYAGVPTSHGNRILRDIPEARDSELVRRFKAAGVLTLGKTNTPEFGLTPFTESEVLGIARNPWDLGRTPGGSSGGAAAAVASGMVPIAGGGDGGGSIRIPASCCGLFGLKPTRGRTPTGPDHGEVWRGFVVEHVITRSVRDSAAMLDATAGPDAGAPYHVVPPSRPFLDETTTEPPRLRIAFTAHPILGHTIHDDCLAGLQETVRLLKRLGHDVSEAAPKIDGDACALAFLGVMAAETRADIERTAALVARKPSLADFEAGTYAVGLMGKQLTASDYVAATRMLQIAAREVGRFFEGFDVLLTPTLASPPIAIGALKTAGSERRLMELIGRFDAGWMLTALGVIKKLAKKAFDFSPYTPLFNVTGQPAMSVPLHWNREGIPIGMQFVGRFGDEATLFRLAGQLERAQPWFDRLPETSTTVRSS